MDEVLLYSGTLVQYVYTLFVLECLNRALIQMKLMQSPAELRQR